MLKINQRNLDRYLKSVTTVVGGCVDEGVEAAKEAAHVLTGRNRESIRQEDPVKTQDGYELRLKVGGIALAGIESEQDIIRDVDYSLEEEVRHPVIGSSAVPAIVNAVDKLRFN